MPGPTPPNSLLVKRTGGNVPAKLVNIPERYSNDVAEPALVSQHILQRALLRFTYHRVLARHQNVHAQPLGALAEGRAHGVVWWRRIHKLPTVPVEYFSILRTQQCIECGGSDGGDGGGKQTNHHTSPDKHTY